jgi:hypothetical protein
MTRPRSLACLLALLIAHGPSGLAAQPASNADSTLRQMGESLRRVWRRDPLTATRPFPALRVVEQAGATCASAPFPASGPLLLVCPDQGEILVHRAKLAALHGVFGDAAEAFVVAYGLGQSLIPPQPADPSLPPATAGLRAACMAGTLLATMPIPAADRRLVLNNAISAGEQAFASSTAPRLGTGPQRAYALFSGMGGTSLDCGATAMARLGGGEVNLESFLAIRGTSVGLADFCREPPECPRWLGFGVGRI